MTDNEIIKALECCTTKKDQYCITCPFSRETNCILKMLDEALDLIKRQKEEIGKAKSEAVREFAEKLKQQAFDDLKYDPILTRYVVSVDDIERIVEEMECE